MGGDDATSRSSTPTAQDMSSSVPNTKRYGRMIGSEEMNTAYRRGAEGADSFVRPVSSFHDLSMSSRPASNALTIDEIVPVRPDVSFMKWDSDDDDDDIGETQSSSNATPRRASPMMSEGSRGIFHQA